ncbi:hypothetical protein ACFLTE_07735 [Bacteroidota bacterium]
MEIKYQLFDKENFLIQKYIGNFSFEKYIQYTRTIFEKYRSVKIKKVLNDFRDMEIDEKSDDFFENVDKMMEIRRKINKKEIKTDDVTVVFWVDKPLPTVIAQLFIRSNRKKDYHYCSSLRKILNILNIPGEYSDLKNVVDNLENTF